MQRRRRGTSEGINQSGRCIYVVRIVNQKGIETLLSKIIETCKAASTKHLQNSTSCSVNTFEECKKQTANFIKTDIICHFGWEVTLSDQAVF
ncbi:hypothetical protein BD560DRAFT_383085 [Blakeslea trispora]|nr:hypothetical protein BD560DRAFT_383085 [Blakeslea trispora]